MPYIVRICRGYRWRRTFERHNMSQKLSPYQHQINTRSQNSTFSSSKAAAPADQPTSAIVKSSSSASRPALGGKRTMDLIQMMKAAGMDVAPCKGGKPDFIKLHGARLDRSVSCSVSFSFQVDASNTTITSRV